MHILIAPNAFKNSLSAAEVACAIEAGLQQSRLHASTECFPVADGGDGTAALILQKLNGSSRKANAHDPLGRAITSTIGFTEDGKTAIIEMADASGLRLLQPAEYHPLRASSYGTGECIRLALDHGAEKIILGVGGTATVDGGCGILQALGVRFLDKNKVVIDGLPENLVSLSHIDLSGIDQRIRKVKLVILCDVDNTMLGSEGAAAVFGPQKGATEKDVKHLEKALSRLRDIAWQQTGKDMAHIKYGGAAGGTAAGLYVFLNAELVNGIEYFLDCTGFDAALQRTDLVITGEGAIDQQTLSGKGPVGVARRAKEKNILVIAMAGKVPLQNNDTWSNYFDVLLAIANQPATIETALADTGNNLYRTARELGNLLALGRHIAR